MAWPVLHYTGSKNGFPIMCVARVVETAREINDGVRAARVKVGDTDFFVREPPGCAWMEDAILAVTGEIEGTLPYVTIVGSQRTLCLVKLIPEALPMTIREEGGLRD